MVLWQMFFSFDDYIFVVKKSAASGRGAVHPRAVTVLGMGYTTNKATPRAEL